MAPFNKRQIGYIQAVAGRQQHTTLIAGQLNRQFKSTDTAGLSQKGAAFGTEDTNKLYNVQNALGGMVRTQGTTPQSKSLFIHTWQLDKSPVGFDSRSEHVNNTLTAADFTNLRPVSIGMGHHTNLSLFDAKCATDDAVTHAHGGLDTSTHQEGVTKFVPNQDLLSSTIRASPDGYLHSTDIKFRFTLPANVVNTYDASGNPSLFPTAEQVGITLTNTATGITGSQWTAFTQGGGNLSGTDAEKSRVIQACQNLLTQYNRSHPMGQDHFEFRWIVWRNKRPTFSPDAVTGEGYSNMDAIRDGFSLRNPAYDLFVGQTGRKRGFLGYTLNANLDQDQDADAVSTEKYMGPNAASSATAYGNGPGSSVTPYIHPLTEEAMTVDDILTMRLNRDDYVIMKDVRFFLGKEHGKSHFEDTLHWDWNDPIDTINENVLSSPTLNNKNFRWNMTLIATSGGHNPIILNECVRWTTKMTSG